MLFRRVLTVALPTAVLAFSCTNHLLVRKQHESSVLLPQLQSSNVLLAHEGHDHDSAAAHMHSPEAASLVKLAESQIMQGRVSDGVLQLLQQASNLEPTSDEPHRLTGVARMIRGEHDQALQSLSSALQLNPVNAETLLLRATVHLRVGMEAREERKAEGEFRTHIDGALDDLAKVLENAAGQKPLIEQAYRLRMLCWVSQENWNQAVAEAERWLKTDPDNAGVKQTLERLREVAKNPEKFKAAATRR